MRGFGCAFFNLEEELMQKEKELTGYPSIDKPWMKYYSDEAINAELPECSLYEYLWQRNKDYPNDYALNYFGKKITFGRLFELIDEAARAFRAIGVQPEDIVSVVTVSNIQSVICFYALNKIGAVSNYLNVLAEKDELENYFNEASSKIVVTLDLFADKVVNASEKTSVEKVIVFSLDFGMPYMTKIGYRIKRGKVQTSWKNNRKVLLWHDFLKKSEGQGEINYKKNPHKMCFLAHTGGTTGNPKAVMVDDCAMNGTVSNYVPLMESVCRQEIFLNIMIPFVMYGILCCMHVPLSLGFCLALVPKFEFADWKKYLLNYHPNYIGGVPSYIIPMLDDKQLSDIDLSDIKVIGVGGDGLTIEKEKEINDYLKEKKCLVDLQKGYGLTEVCAVAVTSSSIVNKVGSVGIPIVNTNILIYNNEEKAELTYGEIGEICIQTPTRMIGYLSNEDATQELFHIHSDGKEWLHTGDLGYIDKDGFLFLVGRIKRIILTTKNGIAYKVYPNIPEKILDEHEAILQSCIVGTTDNGNQILKAYIVLGENKRYDTAKIEQELTQLCVQKLPEYSRPAFYEFCDSLPLTPAGKVDYRKLEEIANGNKDC